MVRNILLLFVVLTFGQANAGFVFVPENHLPVEPRIVRLNQMQAELLLLMNRLAMEEEALAQAQNQIPRNVETVIFALRALADTRREIDIIKRRMRAADVNFVVEHLDELVDD